jgi:thioredoxin-related protein
VQRQVRMLLKVENFLKLNMMVKYMNFFSLILTLFLLVSHLKNDDNRQLSGRKRTQIDLENTEGVFSQQGSFFCHNSYFQLTFSFRTCYYSSIC